MTDSSKVRVLVIDNDYRVGRDLRAMLDSHRYDVAIVHEPGPTLPQKAEDAARDFRPHVAVVDLRLVNDYATDDRSGLKLLENLRSTRCVLYSAYLEPGVTREAAQKYGVNWISKRESPQLLLDAIADAAAKTAALQGKLAIQWPSAWDPQKIIHALLGQETNAPADSVNDILCQLFPGRKQLTVELLEGQAVSSAGVFHRQSVILKATPDNLQPVVVKLARADKIQTEVQNYLEYVQDRLVGRFHPQLERSASFWELGGVVYSFLGSVQTTLPSFTIFYRRETDPQVILKPVYHFFEEVWSKHYKQARPSGNPPILQAYDKNLDLTEWLSEASIQMESCDFSGLSGRLPSPTRWTLMHLDDSRMPDAREAIIHGDLHGDNLFVDGEHAWAVDFRHTGPGPILRDFVTLEVDILTRLAQLPEDDFQVSYELAVTLTKAVMPQRVVDGFPQLPVTVRDHPEAAKALMVIAGLRRLAYQVTGFSDMREYYWGLLACALSIAGIAPEESVRFRRAMLVAAVISGRLSEWSQEWPSSEWPPVETIPLQEEGGLRLLQNRLQSRLLDLQKQREVTAPQSLPQQIQRLQEELTAVERELYLRQLWRS